MCQQHLLQSPQMTYANRPQKTDIFHLGNVFVQYTMKIQVAFGLIIITNESLVLGMWSLAW